ncbi:MAG: RadC family protein [Oscillospiraceae bacterium]
MANNHHHDGHRERVRQKFLESQFNTFQEHEILEMLLFYSIPRKNTNEIAHVLIDKFGSLANVFDADINLLQEVDGISLNSAILLKMIPPLLKKYVNSEDINRMGKNISLKSIDTILDFCPKQFIGNTTELLKAIYLDNSCNLISCVDICTIDSNSTIIINATKIIERAEKYNSNKVILVHNHPKGNLNPSQDDISSTNRLYKVFKELNLNLLDHIIVSGNKAISMVDNGFLLK